MKILNRKTFFWVTALFIPLLLAWSLFAQFSDSEENLQIANAPGESSSNPSCKYYGYWDHLYAPGKLKKGSNVGMSYNAYDGRSIIDDGLKAIINVSHGLEADESEDRWRIKLRGYARSIKNFSPEDVLWILLWDEPFNQGGFTIEQLKRMTESAREIIGTEYKYGFTFTDADIIRRTIPGNIDVVGINYYPFFNDLEGYPQIYTQKEFNNYFNKLVGISKKLAPEAKLSITGQGFYGGKWRKPPVESAKWYIDASQTEDVISVIYWKFRSGRWKGIEDMPEFFEAQKKAFSDICL